MRLSLQIIKLETSSFIASWLYSYTWKNTLGVRRSDIITKSKAGILCDVDLWRDCVNPAASGGTTAGQRDEGELVAGGPTGERMVMVMMWWLSVFSQWQCQSCLQCCLFINAVVLPKDNKQELLVTTNLSMSPSNHLPLLLYLISFNLCTVSQTVDD